MKPSRVARLWLIFSCLCLLISGSLALVITFAKMPYIKDLVANLDVIRWCLVVHVNLATLVWFSSFPLGLVFHYLSESRSFKTAGQQQVIGLWLSVVGVFLMITAFPYEGMKIYMSNYVPVIMHQRFFIGISLYILGLLFNILYFPLWKALLERFSGTQSEMALLRGLKEAKVGMTLGLVFFAVAVITFVFGFVGLVRAGLPYDEFFFESLFWGPGHILQHASTTFAVVCWAFLLSVSLKKPVLSYQTLFKIFIWLGLPLLCMLPLVFISVVGETYRSAFTSLMQWGIFPPVLVFIAIAFFRSLSAIPSKAKGYLNTSVYLSMVLMIIGFVFGAFIRGSDLRIPAHYHAAIGSVTLVFMASTYYLLSGNMHGKWIQRSVKSFFVGQVLFSGGMFLAGALGLGRKTYGAEHAVSGFWQNTSFLTMAVGGGLAFLGGLFFAFAVWPHLFKRQNH